MELRTFQICKMKIKNLQEKQLFEISIIVICTPEILHHETNTNLIRLHSLGAF